MSPWHHGPALLLAIYVGCAWCVALGVQAGRETAGPAACGAGE